MLYVYQVYLVPFQRGNYLDRFGQDMLHARLT